MSNTSAPPSLDDYPGYFPAAKPPFWTRTKVGAASGVMGLLLGGLVGSVATSDSDKEPAVEDLSSTVADLEQEVADTEAELRLQAEESRAALEEAEAALDQAKLDAKAAQKKAVAKAVAEEKARQEAEEAPAPDLGGFVGTTRPPDPRFDTCPAAVAAGYGPYLLGIDAEYGWYADTDNDGLACES